MCKTTIFELIFQNNVVYYGTYFGTKKCFQNKEYFQQKTEYGTLKSD